jgi:hypothetical protein
LYVMLPLKQKQMLKQSKYFATLGKGQVKVKVNIFEVPSWRLWQLFIVKMMLFISDLFTVSIESKIYMIYV